MPFRRLDLVLLTLALLLQPAAAGRLDPLGQRMLNAFHDWVRAHRVSNASFAAMHGGRIIATASVGDHNAREPERIANLSETVTGVCAIKLAETGALNFSTRLRQAIPFFFEGRPHLAIAKHENITLGALMMHTSGLLKDPTLGNAKFDALDWRKSQYAKHLALAMPGRGPQWLDEHNNVNFATLALVIEAITGMRYEHFCRETVLDPAGVRNAFVEPELKALGPYAGWRMSVVDYARFLEHFRPRSGLIKLQLYQWPIYESPSRVFKSMGMELEISPSNGALLYLLADGGFRWSDPARPERNLDFGSSFMMLNGNGNTRYVATFAPQPNAAAVWDLRVRVYHALSPPP